MATEIICRLCRETRAESEKQIDMTYEILN